MGYQTSKIKYAKVAHVAVLVALCFIAPRSTLADTIVSTQSLSVSAIVLDPNAVTPPPPSSGGGGGYVYDQNPSVNGGGLVLSGTFAPKSHISLLLGGIPVRDVMTDEKGFFEFKLESLSTGTYSLLIVARDNKESPTTSSVSFVVYVNDTVETQIKNILFPPLFYDSGFVYKQGEVINLSGRGIASSMVTLQFDETLLTVFDTDGNGFYKGTLKQNFAPGKHFVSVKQMYGSSSSVFSKMHVVTIVKKESEKTKKEKCSNVADFSSDCRVNLIDFSILAYWHTRSNFPEKYDLNKDGKISLRDFSIMAYHWTD